MRDTLILVLLTALASGIITAGLVVLLSRKNLRLALLLSPLVALLSVGTGLVVGVQRMLISGSLSSILLTLAAALPVALAAGAVVSHTVGSRIESSEMELARERAARELDESRRELMTWMSHDLRTPIAGIRAMAEALTDGMAPDPGAYHREILSQAERTSLMVSDLMSLSKLESDGVTTSREPIDVADIVSDLVAGLSPLAAQRNITLMGRADGPADIQGDPQLVTRAIQNLLTNAIDYSPEGSTVSANVSRGSAITVEVIDSCGGIDPAIIPHMTEPGWRADSARTPGPHSGGSGLGLAITARVLAGHDGRLEIIPDGDRCRMIAHFPPSITGE